MCAFPGSGSVSRTDPEQAGPGESCALSTGRAKVLAVRRGHPDIVWGVAWSPCGTLLATRSSDGTGTVWDLRVVGPCARRRAVTAGRAGDRRAGVAS
ncbi:WD40 repeat domain-containing protein [Streptomyces sp. BK239]|uniref:WD40 repeat domain-containing protein n=1 Tax=Streptomyces sp. BK239 TaxID=2512155 RepID=UPI00387EDFB7